MRIIVGNKYIVKSWETMEKQYGISPGGSIRTPAFFTEDMREYCNKIVTVAEYSCGYYKIEEDGGFFTGMIVCWYR